MEEKASARRAQTAQRRAAPELLRRGASAPARAPGVRGGLGSPVGALRAAADAQVALAPCPSPPIARILCSVTCAVGRSALRVVGAYKLDIHYASTQIMLQIR